MLTLIDKGLSRQKAYELVQRNAMKTWEKNRDFLKLLKADADITAILAPEELEPLFNEQYYLRYIDDIFKRIGLTSAQWKEKATATEDKNMVPRSI